MIYKFLFIILWPIMWFIFPLTRRARVMILNDKNQILLVKHKIGMGKWSLPGGGIKLHETVEDAAKREIEEELSVILTKVKVLNENFQIIHAGGIMFRLHFVYAKINDNKISPNWEIGHYKWFDLNNLDYYSNEIKAGITLLNKSSIEAKTD